MFDKIKQAFQKRADRNRAHRDLLRAIADHDLAGVKEISADRELVNLNSYPYLAKAVDHGTPKILEALLENGADPNLWSPGIRTRLVVPPIAEAIVQEKPDMVAVLLADPRIESPDKVHIWTDPDRLLTASAATLIGFARNRGNQECVELLEKHMLEKYKNKYDSDSPAAGKKPSEPRR